ncbi:hypothetical protein SETIT_5G094100v2 [Setaria italica]|uniref:Protein kinase domain-containing protein n=1 Tax=Setaria italica TaxID=4555 RepID=A0A368R3B1_SETIT|nr:hypothetical protein SETIT_5G094100v2 [Setaria italica]
MLNHRLLAILLRLFSHNPSTAAPLSSSLELSKLRCSSLLEFVETLLSCQALMDPSFASPVWAVWSLILMLAASATAAPANVQGGDCSANIRCGNLNISKPFGIVPDQATEPNCGSLGFQVICKNHTPYLGYYHPNKNIPDYYQLQILDIFYGNGSLLVADMEKLEDLRNLTHEDCQQYRFPTANTSSKIALPFSIDPIVNQNLILYNCTKPPAPAAAAAEGLAERSCGNNTLYARVGDERGNSSSDDFIMEGCTAIFVPVRGGYGKASASNYAQLLSDGFLLTWQLTPQPLQLPPPHPPLQPRAGSRNGTGRKIILIVLMTVAASLLLPCIYVLVWHRKRGKLHFFLCEKTSRNTERNIEALLVLHGSLAPKRYKYSEVTKITSSFDNKLGEGGYGAVFKGRLDDGRLVAVKFLHNSKGEGEEFVNEVMSIGRTSHVNIVNLFGFCLEGSKRALIYEFMPNGSLDKFIYSENPKAVLGWDKLYTIAIGIARGLEYLHHNCNTRIIHFDIKPQNILLDEDFHPKVADFGLAKLCHTKESKLSMTGARGTVGFIAPEVHSRTFGVVSTKSDVYSYGMMLLEMVGGRKNVKSVAQKSSEKYFPHWIYDHFRQGDGLQACEVSSEDEGIAKKMSVIGLWCIQILPMHRPTIAKVLEMFERGLDDLDMPPRQNFSQILTSTRSGTKTQVFSEVLKMKEMSVVNSKSLHRLPTL